MTAVFDVTIQCDRLASPECVSRDPSRAEPGATSATQARRAARALGWHQTGDGEDICPECWSRRVRYRAGRPVTGH